MLERARGVLGELDAAPEVPRLEAASEFLAEVRQALVGREGE